MNIWSRLVFEEKTIGIPGVHSMGQYNYMAAHAGLPLHQHRGCVELSLLVKGNQTYQLGGESYHVKGGECYISLPGEPHDTGGEPQGKGILYWLILDVTKNPKKILFLTPEAARKLTADLLKLPSRHFVADPESQATLDKAFKVLQHIRKPDEYTGIFEKADHVSPPDSHHVRKRLGLDDSFHLLEAANHICCYILKTIAASRASTRSISPAIQASIDFISKNEKEWFTVTQVAEHIHLSESYFKILFREEVGLPPAEYMLRQKVDLAKKFLGKENCNITELAYQLGFSSSQYFATVFKRFTDLTPSEFMSGRRPRLIRIRD